MTPQEAITELLTDKLCLMAVASHPSLVNVEEIGIAISALEKQIPKKPVKKNPICYNKTKDGQEYYAYDYHCPVCDEKLKLQEHHCPCGQAIDWSDADG